ncbi:MAG: head-tail connector protein [Methylophilaceae bacterium]
MGTIVITEPTEEPVSVAEAKLHGHVDDAAEDTLIGIYISAAREQCEHILGRSIMPQTLELTLDQFPVAEIELLKPPVTDLVGVYYADPVTLQEVTLASDQYTLDTKRSGQVWLLPTSEASWPETADVANAVRVRYEAGYVDVPKGIKLWILMAVATWYKNREAVISGTIVAKLPDGFYGGLLDRHRIWQL